MFVKEFQCKRFAGLKDKHIQFEDGINVLSGPNEAGKSTIVDAIYSTIFRSSKLNNTKAADKAFKNRSMPVSSGDCIDSIVRIDADGKEYEISKSWGSKMSSELKNSDGEVIKDELNITQCINGLFKYGEGTYGSLVFAKQRELKEALDDILKNNDARSTIGSILRKAVMELDGVSVDELIQKIDVDLKELLNKWDIVNSRPEGNKVISHQYKKGYGAIYKYYIDKEIKKADMGKALKKEQAKLNLAKIDKLNGEISVLNGQIKTLLENDRLEDLERKLKELRNLGEVRESGEIEEVSKNERDTLDCKSEINKINAAITGWTTKYNDQSSLLDELVRVKGELLQKQKELSGLALLPEEFNTADEFIQNLKQLKEDIDKGNKDLEFLKDDYREKKNGLSECSYEELSEQYEQLEKQFNQYVSKAKNLLRVKEVVESTMKDLDKNSFKPLIDSFIGYLSDLTSENYSDANIDKDFGLELRNKDNNIMPVELLSSGTYDCVALALRFAMLDNIYGEEKGFVVLDDCLVDLDPDRKEKAAEFIKRFGERNQVIFTTCSPETARL